MQNQHCRAGHSATSPRGGGVAQLFIDNLPPFIDTATPVLWGSDSFSVSCEHLFPHRTYGSVLKSRYFLLFLKFESN